MPLGVEATFLVGLGVDQRLQTPISQGPHALSGFHSRPPIGYYGLSTVGQARVPPCMSELPTGEAVGSVRLHPGQPQTTPYLAVTRAGSCRRPIERRETAARFSASDSSSAGAGIAGGVDS